MSVVHDLIARKVETRKRLFNPPNAIGNRRLPIIKECKVVEKPVEIVKPSPEPVFDQLYPKIIDIQIHVARAYGLSILDLKCHRRQAYTVHARHVAMYFARKLTLFSLPAIGRHFGDRDHTTVMHGANKIKFRRTKDNQLNEILDEIEAAITGKLK